MALLTPANLQRLSSWPHLVNTWYLVTAAALCATNRSAEIPTLYTYVIQKSNSEDRRQLTTRMREALFKTAPLVGLPRAINALTALANVTSAENRDTAAGRPVIDTWEARMEEIDRGKSHWNTTYGKVAQRVQEQMVYAGGSDLWTYVLEHVYAPVLSYEGILECGESALVVIGTLAATGADGAGPQLKGHFIGAVRGAGVAQEAAEEAQRLGEWVLRDGT